MQQGKGMTQEAVCTRAPTAEKGEREYGMRARDREARMTAAGTIRTKGNDSLYCIICVVGGR